MRATDLRVSSEFYEKVFGWRIRPQGDGSVCFDDPSGEVSGSWALDRPLATPSDLMIYLTVESVSASIDAVLKQGGKLVQPINADASEITARFSDPAGNVIGLCQEPSRSVTLSA